MGDLNLKGTLNLAGALTLKASGGKVTVGGKAALVVQPPTGKHGNAAAPVPQPPPAPINTGLPVVAFMSFNQTVKVGNNAIITMGMVMQGEPRLWPGMVLPSTNNTGVTINRLFINVEGDTAVIFPSGGSATLDQSGQ